MEGWPVPSVDQLIKLGKLPDYEMPEDPYDVVWFMEHVGNPKVISLAWKSREEFLDYIQNHVSLGHTHNFSFPHYRKRHD